MHIDVLIIGQGICGTFLHWYLSKAQYNCVVVDDNNQDAASKIAAGIINPVTGRRMVQTWMIDELMPFATEAYLQIGDELSISAIEQKSIVDFFPSPQMRIAFTDRVAENAKYLSLQDDETFFHHHFQYDFGFGSIEPAYLVHLDTLLPAYRKKLKAHGLLLEEHFEESSLKYEQQRWVYKDFHVSHIVFCDGISAALRPWFSNLPFAPNKGEVLFIECRELPATHIFKKGMNLVPLYDDIFWVGSSYEWNFSDDKPTTTFRERTTKLLTNWLKVPFKILDHRAAVRPATIERRPFMGFHPLFKNMGILNGMGTKGCTLAPYFASQICKFLVQGTPLNPEADIQRFRNLLSRSVNL